MSNRFRNDTEAAAANRPGIRFPRYGGSPGAAPGTARTRPGGGASMPTGKRGSKADGRTTIRDIAAQAEVSVATVSRVLAGNYPVSADLRSRVMRVVHELDYV